MLQGLVRGGWKAANIVVVDPHGEYARALGTSAAVHGVLESRGSGSQHSIPGHFRPTRFCACSWGPPGAPRLGASLNWLPKLGAHSWPSPSGSTSIPSQLPPTHPFHSICMRCGTRSNTRTTRHFRRRTMSPPSGSGIRVIPLHCGHHNSSHMGRVGFPPSGATLRCLRKHTGSATSRPARSKTEIPPSEPGNLRGSRSFDRRCAGVARRHGAHLCPRLQRRAYVRGRCSSRDRNDALVRFSPKIEP